MTTPQRSVGSETKYEHVSVSDFARSQQRITTLESDSERLRTALELAKERLETHPLIHDLIPGMAARQTLAVINEALTEKQTLTEHQG